MKTQLTFVFVLILMVSCVSLAVDPPTVTTVSATDVQKTSAVLNGYLDYDGGQACIVWFEYWKVGATYSLNTGKQFGKRTGDSFSCQVNNLLPNTQYRFKAWAENSEDIEDGGSSTFTTLRDIVTLTVSSTTGGSVICPGEGSYAYDRGDAVTIEAKADDGYHFTSWTGDSYSTANPLTITIGEDCEVVANFEPDAQQTFSLTISSTAGDSVTDPGEGGFDYGPNTEVAVTATPDTDYYFSHWSGTAADAGKVTDPYNASTTVLVDVDYTLAANFEHNEACILESFETGDFSAMPWEHSDIPWQITDMEANTGTYSACSGYIDDSQTSTLSLSCSCTDGEIRFAVKVSSEEKYDKLVFYMDGNEIASWSGNLDWTDVNVPVTAGSHELSWSYEKDKTQYSGKDTAWIDDVCIPGLTITRSDGFESSDFSALNWEHQEVPWLVTDLEAYTGTYSARSGIILDNEASTLALTLDCQDGSIDFAVKVSSEEKYDNLFFFIDGLETDSWSGELPWTEVTYPVPAGNHTFTWTYCKDKGDSAGQDAAWIDDVILPGSAAPGEPNEPNDTPVSPHDNAKVVWVTETMDCDEDGVQDDQAWIDFLTAQNYNLDLRPDYWMELTEGKVAELNTANLVIISRNTNSGSYDDGNEPDLWGSVTTPIISISAWHIRGNRWKWVSSASVIRTLDTYMIAAEPEHPLFAGVALENNSVEIAFTEGFTDGYQGYGVIGNLDLGNGTLIGKTFNNEMSIAEWPAGMEGYDGAGIVQAGKRMLFAAGTDNASTTSSLIPQGAWNLTDAGEQMFANAIEYMLSESTNLIHSYTFEDGTARDSIGTAHGTLVGDAHIVNGSLVLDGIDDWMEMPGDVIAMNSYDEVTIEAWYTPAAGGNPIYSMLAYFGGSTDPDPESGLGVNYFYMSSAYIDDKSCAAISVDDKITAPWESETSADGPEYDDGLLHHMVATINATDIALYIDGALEATTPLSAMNKLSGISNDLALLAKSGYCYDPEWAGEIHEFNIYNQALSLADVQARYAASVSGDANDTGPDNQALVTIFDTYPANPSQSTTVGTSSAYQEFEPAYQFVVNGFAYKLQKITVTGSDYGGVGIVLHLYSDEGGIPGTELASW